MIQSRKGTELVEPKVEPVVPVENEVAAVTVTVVKDPVEAVAERKLTWQGLEAEGSAPEASFSEMVKALAATAAAREQLVTLSALEGLLQAPVRGTTLLEESKPRHLV